MLVGDTEAHALEAAAAQIAQQLDPERLRLNLAQVEADHLAPARLVDGIGDHERLRADVAAVADLDVLGVQPQVRVVALERPPPERLDLLVESAAEGRDPVLRHPLDPELLDQPVDLAGRDAVHVREHDRHNSLLGARPRLQKRREVGRTRTLARDRELDLTDPRLPPPLPITVAMRQPLDRHLTTTRTDLDRHLRLHQLTRDDRHRLTHEIAMLTRKHVGNNIRNSHPSAFGHRGAPLIDSWMNRRVWSPRWPEPYSGPTRAPLHHFYRRDRL